MVTVIDPKGFFVSVAPSAHGTRGPYEMARDNETLHQLLYAIQTQVKNLTPEQKRLLADFVTNVDSGWRLVPAAAVTP